MQTNLELIKPLISNVVCTANLSQYIDFWKLQKFGWATYDQAIYGGTCAYVKLPEMRGRVTIFSNGKLISVGGKTIEEAKKQLFQTKYLLIEAKLISQTEIIPKVVNMVATLNLKRVLNLEKISQCLEDALYDPDNFAGIILKNILLPTCLIFASGKIVIAGSKSETELSKISLKIQQKLAIF